MKSHDEARLTKFSSCFQKDIFNIVYLSESLHLYEVADYWRSIITMNEHQKHRFTKRIISCLYNNLTNKKIAVLGFAFKKDTNDTRESPAIRLVNNFIAERAQVAVYDPKVKEQQIRKELADDGGDLEALDANLEFCLSAYTACANADAVVVVTEWDEFSNKGQQEGHSVSDSPSVLNEIDPNSVLKPKTSTATDRKHYRSPPLSLPHRSYAEKTNSHFRSFIEERTNGLDTAAAPQLARERLNWARIAKGMKRPMFVFDGRNILDAPKLEALGFRVEAIGRASTVARDIHD